VGDAPIKVRSRAADEAGALGAVDELGDRALGEMHPSRELADRSTLAPLL
jgi:hypothetical protein